jgi:hypothetical protein
MVGLPTVQMGLNEIATRLRGMLGSIQLQVVAFALMYCLELGAGLAQRAVLAGRFALFKHFGGAMQADKNHLMAGKGCDCIGQPALVKQDMVYNQMKAIISRCCKRGVHRIDQLMPAWACRDVAYGRPLILVAEYLAPQGGSKVGLGQGHDKMIEAQVQVKPRQVVLERSGQSAFAHTGRPIKQNELRHGDDSWLVISSLKVIPADGFIKSYSLG